MQKIKGIQRQGCGPGMPGPYGVAWMSCGRRPAPRNVVKWDVGRPAPRPPRTFAVMRSPADCCRGAASPTPPEGSRPLPTMQKIKGIQRQGCGPGMPGPYGVAWMSCGRRPAPRNVVKWDVGRPAPRPPRTFAVMRSPADCCRGAASPTPPEGSRPLPTMQKIKGIQWQGCGPGMPGPYGLL